MVRKLQSWIVLLARVGVPAAAFAARPGAAAMTAPSRAVLGTRITARATGLKPGRYTLLLATQLPTQGVSPTICSAPIGSGSARAGTLTVRGKLPDRLACRMGDGPSEGQVPVRKGSYDLSLGVLLPPAAFRAGSFAKRTIHLVK
jgi:hypothetical protein